MREQHGLDLQPQQATRSVGTHAGIHPDDTNSLSGDLYSTRLPTSVVRRRAVRITHHPAGVPIPPRASRQAPTMITEDINEPLRRRHFLAGRHPLFYIGGTLILFLVGWFLIGWLLNWVKVQEDQLHYGYPRTYQTDKDVGHGGTSHFTVENLGGHIFVYELPGNDASKALIYSGPTLSGENADLAPAIVTFSDVTGHGRLDMVIEVDNTKYIYYNGTDGKFHEQMGG